MSKKINKNGFMKHAKIERMLLNQLANSDDLDYIPLSARRHKDQELPPFIENVGDIEVFSLSEIINYWRKADIFYSDDRKKSARKQLEDVVNSGVRKNFVKSPKMCEIDALSEQFPNFKEAISHIKAAIALSTLTESQAFEMSPLLLIGPPGVGKTAFCQSFANILNTPFRRLDIGGMSSSAIIAGLSFGWATGHTGQVLNTFIESSIVSPMFLLDELDKIRGHDFAPIQPALLALLEPESCSSFQDEGLLIRFDCSRIIWVASANDIEAISKPLLTRFNIVQINQPDKVQAIKIINNIYLKLRASRPWGRYFNNDLSEEVSDALCDLPPREITMHLKKGFGSAARRNSSDIKVIDLPLQKPCQVKNKIGFI